MLELLEDDFEALLQVLVVIVFLCQLSFKAAHRIQKEDCFLRQVLLSGLDLALQRPRQTSKLTLQASRLRRLRRNEPRDPRLELALVSLGCLDIGLPLAQELLRLCDLAFKSLIGFLKLL